MNSRRELRPWEGRSAKTGAHMTGAKDRRTRLNSPGIAGPLSFRKNGKRRADDVDHGL
jgi:hypothetical protein